MINLVFGVWDKAGNKLLGPIDTGALWAGFPIEDCTDPSGDPIVLYDQTTDRWLLSQFTTRGLDDPTLPFYNCVAISTSGDPTGSYYRYAFITQPDVDGGYYFPDYPKYGVWTNSYLMTTRDFGSVDGYGISVYALEKNKMVNGEAKARADPVLPRLGRPGRQPRGHRRRAPAGGHRRQPASARARAGADRRHPGRRRRLRRGSDRGRAQHLRPGRASGRRTRSRRSPGRSSSRRRRSTRSSRARRPRATASRSRERFRRSTSTSSRTGSGRPTGSPTGTSARTRRS